MKKNLLTYLLFFISTSISFAKQITDSTLSYVHRFDREEYFKLKNSGDYEYVEDGEKALSLLERILEWIAKILQKILPENSIKMPSGNSYDSVIFSWVIVIVFMAILIFIFIKMKKEGLFKSKAKRIIPEEFDIIEENIHEIAFIDEITQAENESNFRRAIRLHYLNTLKHLDDNGFIKWTPNTTNSDFKRMMRNSPYFDAFKELLWIYEYAWYGLSNPNLDDYTKLKEAYITFQSNFNKVKA